mgnify:CR=1 FL=1
MRELPALEVSLLLLMEPVLNPLWTWLVRGEEPGLWVVAGGAVIIAAKAVMTSAYSREAERFSAVSESDGNHPALRRAARWEGVRFFYAVKADPGSATVVARLSDKTPILMEKKIAEGRVLLFASTFDNVTNDYNVDRVAQKNFTYTGIKTFPLQDIAMMENQWGPISERWQEHLTSADYAIIKVRRRLLKAARDYGLNINFYTMNANNPGIPTQMGSWGADKAGVIWNWGSNAPTPELEKIAVEIGRAHV